MTGKFILSCVAFLSCFYLSAHAQLGMGKPEEVKLVKERPLIVVMEVVDEKIEKKLRKKPEELENYKNYCHKLNESLKSAVSKCWNFNNKGILFKTRSEIESLKKRKENNYAIMDFDVFEVGEYTTNYDNSARFLEDSWKSAIMRIDIIEKYDPFEKSLKSKPVYYTSMPSVYPSDADLVFGVQMIQNYLMARIQEKPRKELMEDLKQYAGVLKSKTLWIAKEDIKEGMSEAEIRDVYPYRFKIVDYARIEDAILNKDDNCIYIMILPVLTNNRSFIHYVVEASTGYVVGFSAPGIGAIYFPRGGRIMKKNFKDYVKYVKEG